MQRLREHQGHRPFCARRRRVAAISAVHGSRLCPEISSPSRRRSSRPGPALFRSGKPFEFHRPDGAGLSGSVDRFVGRLVTSRAHSIARRTPTDPVLVLASLLRGFKLRASRTRITSLWVRGTETWPSPRSALAEYGKAICQISEGRRWHVARGHAGNPHRFSRVLPRGVGGRG